MSALLNLKNVHAYYGAAHILHGVSFAVRRGEVLALMGRNGAGKSTTLKSIAGLLARTEGERRARGRQSLTRPHRRSARSSR